MDLLEALSASVLVADGAMGTLLRARGASADSCLEEFCATRSEVVSAIHRDYLAAGARLIRTHSFGANAARLAQWGFERRVGELNWLAARIARDAAKGTGAFVAASVGPTGLGAAGGKCFEEQLGGLLDGGADCVVFETFTDLDELAAALEAKQSLHHCPAVANLVCDSQGRIGGRSLGEAWEFLRSAGAEVIGINCVGTPADTLAFLPDPLPEDTAAFPSAGLPEATGAYALSPETFASDCAGLIDRGIRLIGGCCGTTPAHIAALAARLAPAE